MTSSIFEVPIGSIDDVNTTFTVAKDYITGSVQVWHNTRMITSEVGWDNGFDEAGGSSIEMRQAPATGDSLRVRSIPVVP